MKEISETALSVYNLLGIGENHAVHARDIQNRTGLPRARSGLQWTSCKKPKALCCRATKDILSRLDAKI